MFLLVAFPHVVDRFELFVRGDGSFFFRIASSPQTLNAFLLPSLSHPPFPSPEIWPSRMNSLFLANFSRHPMNDRAV